MEIDASKVAVSAVLSQKKKIECFFSIQSASWMMNSAERKYAAYEQEALKIIFWSEKVSNLFVIFSPVFGICR